MTLLWIYLSVQLVGCLAACVVVVQELGDDRYQ